MNSVPVVHQTGDAASTRYRVELGAPGRHGLASGWLALAVSALLVSGLLSILLVLSRAPYVKDFFPWVDFFHVALVVHVDLSVLVWFIAFGGALWSLSCRTRLVWLGWTALALASCGTVLMAAAPFVGGGRPIMANYIPVLDEPVFLTGLFVFGMSAAALTVRTLSCAGRVETPPDGAAALRFGLRAAAISLLFALIAFAWSWIELPGGLDRRAYYELMFWGGGHVLQFTYTLLMLVAWLWLADVAGAKAALTPRVTILFFALAVMPAFLTPAIYLAYDVGSVEHHRLLTELMRYGGGLAIVPFTLAIVITLVRGAHSSPDAAPMRAALVTSIVLFDIGGVIGFMIQGSNVKIPAHYHGSIVGVTLALMGLTYALLPRLGFAPINARLARLQPWLYGSGQLLHIIGLVWSGGYGVQRKVAGAEQPLRTFEQVAGMGLMGLGGLVAVLGGVLFAVIVIRAMANGRRT